LRDIEAVIKGFEEQVASKQEREELTTRMLGKQPGTAEEAISAIQSLLLKDFLAFLKPFNSELAYNDPYNF